MTHSFDIEIAKKLSVNSAIIYQNLQFWCLKNKANKKHFHDNNYWTYNSVNAWAELFPYLGASQIKTALKKLEEEGYIESGEYNKSSYDRTKWYAIIDLAVLANGLDGNSQRVDGNSQPIPDIKPTDNKPDNNTNINISLRDTATNETDLELYHFLQADETINAFKEYLELRKKLKCSNSPLVIARLTKKLKEFSSRGHNPLDIILNAITSNWKDFYEPKTNQKSFQQQEREITQNIGKAVSAGFDPFNQEHWDKLSDSERQQNAIQH